MDLTATYWKKPTSSKNIDRKVIEMNNTSIFRGLTEVFAVNSLMILSLETKPNKINNTAAIIAITQ